MYRVLSLIILLFCSCSEQKIEKKDFLSSNESVVILKGFNPSNKVFYGNSYVETFSFPIEITDPLQVRSQNIEVSDTIVVIHSNEIMMININYNPQINNHYFLKQGDTLIVDFTNLKKINEYYQNKNVLPGDLNRVRVLSDSVFKNLYFSTDQSFLERYYLSDSLNNLKSMALIDSLWRNKMIHPEIYGIRKQDYLIRNTIRNPIQGTSYLKEDKFIGLKSYQSFLNKYTLEHFSIGNIYHSNSYYVDYKTAFDSVYQADIYGEKAKDYLLFYYLDRMTESFSYNDFKERFEKFKQTAKDTTLVAFLEDKYLLNFTDLKKETQEIYFINSQKQKQTLSQFLEENKGKVIYIDFWASWCAPCRALMPASRELHKQYKDKDVVFLYLSIDNDFEKWQKANRDEGLSQNRFSLLTVNYPNADFYKELNLRSIPRYLLYDKQGNLVHKNAPSPDSDIIKQELDKLLKN